MTGNDSEFARWLGVNKSTVSRARRAGRLALTADGLVEFEASAARWHETAGGRTDVAARHAAQRGSVIPTAAAPRERATAPHDAATAGQIDSGEDASPAGSNRASAKAALLHYENSMIKLEMALRRGLRIERQALRREAQGLGAMLRAGIERVIDQTAPRLAACDNDLQRRQILDGEIHRLRWVIKREFPRALRGMGGRPAPAYSSNIPRFVPVVERPKTPPYHGEVAAPVSREKRAVSMWGEDQNEGRDE